MKMGQCIKELFYRQINLRSYEFITFASVKIFADSCDMIMLLTTLIGLYIKA